MLNRLTGILAVAAAFGALCFAAPGCSKKVTATGGAGGGVVGMGQSPAAGVDCYNTAGAVACPPDADDPSGKKLPVSGAVCSLPRCKPCGSATSAAFRDATGGAQSGWCICVPKSDDSGIGIYSCFTTADWPSRSR